MTGKDELHIWTETREIWVIRGGFRPEQRSTQVDRPGRRGVSETQANSSRSTKYLLIRFAAQVRSVGRALATLGIRGSAKSKPTSAESLNDQDEVEPS